MGLKKDAQKIEGTVKKVEGKVKKATRRARKPKAEAAAVAPEAEAPSGPSVTTGEIVTIEDLSFVPPIRAHGASEEQARAAYEAQVELRGRHDAQAETPSPGVQTSDLTPGRSVEN